MDYSTIITGPVLAMLVLDGLKWLIRQAKKDPVYEFPAKFYIVMLPVLNILAPYGLWLLNLAALPTYSWQTLGQEIASVVLASLISAGAYTVTLQPFKAYRSSLAEKAAIAKG